MFSTLTTATLVDRAIRAVSDPDVSPYSLHTSKALKATLTALNETHRRFGPAPGFSTLRDLSISILVDFDDAETYRAEARRAAAAEKAEQDRAEQAHHLSQVGA